MYVHINVHIHVTDVRKMVKKQYIPCIQVYAYDTYCIRNEITSAFVHTIDGPNTDSHFMHACYKSCLSSAMMEAGGSLQIRNDSSPLQFVVLQK